jgi:hypothetical protein
MSTPTRLGLALLRARRERPRGRAAKQRDEVTTADASCHLIPSGRGVARPNDSTIRSGISQNKKGFPSPSP